MNPNEHTEIVVLDFLRVSQFETDRPQLCSPKGNNIISRG